MCSPFAAKNYAPKIITWLVNEPQFLWPQLCANQSCHVISDQWQMLSKFKVLSFLRKCVHYFHFNSLVRPLLKLRTKKLHISCPNISTKINFEINWF
jgi:hypothetical protein